MLQLLQYLFARNRIRESQRGRPVGHRERNLRGRKMLPDELEHQELVEIRVQRDRTTGSKSQLWYAPGLRNR